MLKKVFLWCQVAFSYILFAWAFLMFIGCLTGGYESFYCIVFAVFSLLAYWLTCVTRSELKGGKA